MHVNQITLAVTDLDRAIAFYQRLGLRLIVRAEDRYARLEAADGEGATLSLHREDVPKPGGATVFFETEDIDARAAALERLGVVFDTAPEDQPWLWREARLRDPDGNRLCLYQAGENRRFPPWRIPAVD